MSSIARKKDWCVSDQCTYAHIWASLCMRPCVVQYTAELFIFFSFIDWIFSNSKLESSIYVTSMMQFALLSPLFVVAYGYKLPGVNLTQDANHRSQSAGKLSVIRECLNLQERVANIQLNELNDKFIWKWTSSREFLVSSTYATFFHGQTYMAGDKELWKAKTPLKCKFFFLACSPPPLLDSRKEETTWPSGRWLIMRTVWST